jgi:hypothetical protein
MKKLMFMSVLLLLSSQIGGRAPRNRDADRRAEARALEATTAAALAADLAVVAEAELADMYSDSIEAADLADMHGDSVDQTSLDYAYGDSIVPADLADMYGDSLDDMYGAS